MKPQFTPDNSPGYSSGELDAMNARFQATIAGWPDYYTPGGIPDVDARKALAEVILDQQGE